MCLCVSVYVRMQETDVLMIRSNNLAAYIGHACDSFDSKVKLKSELSYYARASMDQLICYYEAGTM